MTGKAAYCSQDSETVQARQSGSRLCCCCCCAPHGPAQADPPPARAGPSQAATRAQHFTCQAPTMLCPGCVLGKGERWLFSCLQMNILVPVACTPWLAQLRKNSTMANFSLAELPHAAPEFHKPAALQPHLTATHGAKWLQIYPSLPVHVPASPLPIQHPLMTS